MALEIEWKLISIDFSTIKEKFGKFDIDLFASNINAKFKKFIFWQADSKSCITDALTVTCSEYYFYAFALYFLIP